MITVITEELRDGLAITCTRNCYHAVVVFLFSIIIVNVL